MNLHSILRDSKIVGVLGSDEDHCSKLARVVAFEVGKLLASNNAIVVTGGNGGVMEHASRGATEAGGIAIGILPAATREGANRHCSLYVPTGIGYARGQIITNMVYGAIVIEGGEGTREEAGQMYLLRKPVVAIASTGGTASQIAGKVLDHRDYEPILSAQSAEEAVDLLLRELENLPYRLDK